MKKLKRMQKKILNKYDKNKNKFISINEYLDVEVSKGPLEKEGDIEYNYQKWDNFYNFFVLLKLKKITAFKILCVPKFVLKYNKYVQRTSVMIDLYLGKYYLPESMINEISRCKKENIRIVYFSFVIKVSKSYFTHANVIIIDLKKKTIERFEPYGYSKWYDSKFVDKIFIKKILKFLELDNFKYLAPEIISNKVGIQKKGDSFCGMCITISMMYLLMRVLNVDVKQKEIVKYFLKFSKPTLQKKILKFAKYVERTLKKNSSLVKHMDFKLYNNMIDDI